MHGVVLCGPIKKASTRDVAGVKWRKHLQEKTMRLALRPPGGNEAYQTCRRDALRLFLTGATGVWWWAEPARSRVKTTRIGRAGLVPFR